MCAGKEANERIDSFEIQGTTIKCKNSVILCIYIDYLLKFDEHVSDICKKNSKQLAVLKRLGRFLTEQGKMTIYNSFIISNFNYFHVVLRFCSALAPTK